MNPHPFAYITILAMFLCQANAEEAKAIGPVRWTNGQDARHLKRYEFSEDPIRDVLRGLAQEAKVSLILSDLVKGDVSVRLEDITPIKALEIICESKGLILSSKDDVYYVITREERLRNLHYLDHPDLPVALANFKKRYYDALVSAGFSKADALKIVISEALPLNDMAITKP